MFGGGPSRSRPQRPESAPATRRAARAGGGTGGTTERGGGGGGANAQRPGSAMQSRSLTRPESARQRRTSAGPAGGGGSARAPRPIRWRCHYRNTVHAAFASRPGWQELGKDEDGHYGATDDSWDIVWSDRAWARDYITNVAKLSDAQHINHYRNNYELTRKDHMVKNLKRMRKSLEKEGRFDEAAQWDFFPTTYVVPQEYGLFYEEFKRNPDSTWIMKPVGSAQGRGIFLFTKLSQIAEWKTGTAKWRPNVGAERSTHAAQPEQVENYVAQKYIDRPFLIGAKKFDLRLYCLVTNFAPLTVWMYRAGFCRFSNHRFSMAKADLHRTHVHLTNVAVQKTAEKDAGGEAGPGTMGEEGDWENDGSKWDLAQLKLFIASRHGMSAANKMCLEMQMVMVRTLLACQPVMINDKHCFELYGFDVMLDESLKPWLIEANSSPALTATSRSDFELKCQMLIDTLDVLDLEGKRSGTETQVGGYDLVWEDGVPAAVAEQAGGSSLGSYLAPPSPSAVAAAAAASATAGRH